MNTGANCRQRPGMGSDLHRASYGNETFQKLLEGQGSGGDDMKKGIVAQAYTVTKGVCQK